MTPTEIQVLRAQMAASLYGATTALLDVSVAIHRADEILRSIGITADEPAPAEPAAPEPDYRTLLWKLGLVDL